MRTRTIDKRTKASGLALLALGILCNFPAQAQEKPKHHHYKLIDFGALGGSQSYFNPGSGNDFNPFTAVINDRGTGAAFADTSVPDPFAQYCFWNCLVTHAFRANSDGGSTDLGALPGGGASSAPLWISENGLIAGLSENGETDPLYAGLPEVHAVLWEHGKITDLGTLPQGGYESEANAVNSAGQVVGAASNDSYIHGRRKEAVAGPRAFSTRCSRNAHLEQENI